MPPSGTLSPRSDGKAEDIDSDEVGETVTLFVFGISPCQTDTSDADGVSFKRAKRVLFEVFSPTDTHGFTHETTSVEPPAWESRTADRPGASSSVLVTSIFPIVDIASVPQEEVVASAGHATILPPMSNNRSPPISNDTAGSALISGLLYQISSAISFGGSGLRTSAASTSSFFSDPKRSTSESSFFSPVIPSAVPLILPGTGSTNVGSTIDWTTSLE